MVTVSVPSVHRWLPFQAVVLVLSLVLGGAILIGRRTVRIRISRAMLEARHGSRVVEIPIAEVGDVVVAVKSGVVRRLEVVRRDGTLTPLTKAFFLGDEIHERAAARAREAAKLDPHEGDGELLAKARPVRIVTRLVWLLAIAAYAGALVVLLMHSQMDIAWVPAAIVVAALVKTALVRYELPL
jgi:hypothetical protein